MKSPNITVTRKVKYPDKTSINLLMKETDKTDPKFQIALFVVFLLVLAVFVKFMVVDKIAEGYQAQQEYAQTQELINQLRTANEDYDKIREEYSHYGNGYLNDEELAEMDRIDILNVIDQRVLNQADIRSLDISGNVATLIIDQVRLSTVSQIVASVEQSSLVSYVTVSTAGTGSDSSSVTATMIIYFNGGGGEQ